jgi:Transposase
VRPYVKAQKNDDRDAEGIAEAATRPTMRFVELKSQQQLDMQTLHRSRDRLVTASFRAITFSIIQSELRSECSKEPSSISKTAFGLRGGSFGSW